MLHSEGESSTLSTHSDTGTEAKAGVVTKDGYILCPVCGRKTTVKTLPETEMKNFPLYCKWCRQQTVINHKGKQPA
nr:MAG TPA: cysteine-rich protein [Caudoviricetes sp.]